MRLLVQYMIGVVLFLQSFVPVGQQVLGADLMEEVFQESSQNGQIIDLGSNKNAVGNAVFKPSIGGKQSLIVRIIKLVMRATLVISVTMMIIVGIRYIYAQGNESEQKKNLDYIRNIVYGILISLGALVIVEVAQSIGRSTVF